MPKILNVLTLVAIPLMHSTASDSIDQVKNRLSDFIEAKATFDETAIDYYDDGAQILHEAELEDGFIRSNELSGKQYKKILTRIWPMLRKNNDNWTFSELEYSYEAGTVSITGHRSSNLHGWKYPYEVRFEQNSQSKWVIIYEYLKTKGDT